MLFEAAYWRKGQERLSLEEGLTRPDLAFLLDGWDRGRDCAVIAVAENGERIGAAWYRFWMEEQHSYGFISPDIPEVAIAVREDFRRRGIGVQLMDRIIKLAANMGIKKMSLSVEVDNPALKMYHQLGFRIVQRVDNAWTMVVNLKDQDC
jgi:ribosomal protein S18 acetylase RimI-like enzyme